MPDLETQLRRYGAHLDERFPDIALDEIVGREPGRARPPARPALRVAVVVALIASVIAVGLLLLDLFTGPGPPVPVITPVPDPDEATDVPTEQPAEDGLESGAWTVETALGTWIWTWVSEPDEAGELWDEVVASMEPDDDELGRVELMELPVPQIDGMTWESSQWYAFWEPVPLVRSGEVTIALREVLGWVDWEAVYGSEVCTWWQDDFTSVALLEPDPVPEGGCPWLPRDDSEPLTTLTVGLAADGTAAVEFVDQQTGTLMLRLEATDPTVSAEQLGPVGHLFDGTNYFAAPAALWWLLVDDAAGFRLVDPPWQRLPLARMDLTAGADGFLAVGAGPADWPAGDRTPLLYSWRSPDGIDWQQLGPPLPLPLDGEVAHLEVVGGATEIVMRISDDREQASIWKSIDGVDWRQTGPDVDGTAPIVLSATDFGWVLGDQRQLPPSVLCEVWVSPDGATWEQVPFPPPDSGHLHDPGGNLDCSLVVDDGVYARTTWYSDPDEPERPAPTGCWPVEWRELQNGGSESSGGGCGLWIGALDD